MEKKYLDLLNILPEDWFEQIGDFDDNEEKYAPIDYDGPVAYALYEANSFFGPEFVDLYVDKDSKIYYLCTATRQPIGDYGWTTIWGWYQSIPDKFQDITDLLQSDEDIV